MFTDFAELAMLICAFAENLPEEMVNAADKEAVEYWQCKFGGHDACRGYSNHNTMRYNNGNCHEAMRQMYSSFRKDDCEAPSDVV